MSYDLVCFGIFPVGNLYRTDKVPFLIVEIVINRAFFQRPRDKLEILIKCFRRHWLARHVDSSGHFLYLNFSKIGAINQDSAFLGANI